jgi:uncharacterized membrane protein YphA (DoxX/SURF4 family)
MRTLFIIGRVIFGGYFIYNGVNHFMQRAAMSGYAAAKGTPAPDAAVMGSGALLLAGGSSVITGIKPREGLAALVAFLVPVSLQMHRFWDETDGAVRQAEMINFTKNMALAGAALAMMERSTPWPLALEGWQGTAGGGSWRRSRTSYPELTPGTLRALAR